MTGVASTRDRDAWATIQGFVYQAEVTIDRWLSLKPGESLLLESGEDISLIAKSFSEGQWTETVLLEQVKHRSGSVTLRTNSAVEFLVHAWEHCKAAGTLRVSCAYVSNCRIGKELDPGFLLDRPGIEIWESTCRQPAAAPGTQEDVEQVRRLVASARRPPAISESQWHAFESEWKEASSQGLFAFFCRIEWRV